MGGNFRRKSRFVADGHKTKTLEEMTYLSLVSRDLVRTILKIAALNDLDVFACDIQNSYLMADCRELVWVLSGPKFEYEAVKNVLEDFKNRNNKIEPPEVYVEATIDNIKVESVKETYIDKLG